MGGDNWATRNLLSTILFSMHCPLPRTINTDSSRYQISRGSKYMYIGNSYWAVHGSFDFFITLQNAVHILWVKVSTYPPRSEWNSNKRMTKFKFYFSLPVKMNQRCITKHKKGKLYIKLLIEFTAVSIPPL